MSMYKNIKQTFKSEYKGRTEAYKERLAAWGNDPAVLRVKKPTNIARARELGYKAKQGVIIARVKVKKGNRKRPTVGGGRKPSKTGRFFSRAKSMQSIAEERASKKFSNCEVLNSYFVGETGTTKFYEIILLDKSSPSIQGDAAYRNIISKGGRAERGLTSSGKKYRGLE